MSDTEQAQQVWPDRSVEVLCSTVIICVLSTIILIWRVAYGVRNKRKMLLCDGLLVIAGILNLTTTAIRFKTVEHGLGKHFNDPRVLHVPGNIKSYSYFLYLNQVLNLLAVSILKYSICAYLLALKFSTVYSIIVWLSVAMVTVFNLLLPLFSNVSCTPFEANWNRAVAGKCWYRSSQPVTYMQGVSNCVTDVVYVVAPIIYLSNVQLSRRTQWGVRSVFLLGLVATVCSIFKTYELRTLLRTKDPTWDGVNLTIWSATELSVGILITSLPPLRKQFDKMFRLILPSTFQTKQRSRSRSRGNSIPLYNTSKPPRSGARADGSSEEHILTEEALGGEGKIVKTTTVVHEVSERGRGGTAEGEGPTHRGFGRVV